MKLPKVKLPKYSSIVKFLEKRFPEILLILLLLSICILSLQPGKYLLSNDNYSPELNPTLSVSRYLESPAWRGYRVLGFASESEQADVFRSGIFAVFDSFLPSWLINQLFYFVSMAIGCVSIACLTRILIQKSKLKRYSNWGYLLSGVIYFSTLWTMWLFYQNMAPYIVNFGFLPLLLLYIYKYALERNWRNLLFIFISSILFSATSIIATLFFIDLIFILAFTIFVNLNKKGNRNEKLKDIFTSLGIFLITQLFWIFPFIHYTLSTSFDIIDSYTNRTITSNVIDLETQSQTLINSARMYNRTLFDMDGDNYLFPMSELFNTYDFYKVVGLLPALFSLIALIFGIFKKNYKLLFWGIFALGCLFLIKVLNPPLGVIFAWLQENIPLFKQVLRWPFSKLGQIYLICISILSTFGVVYLIKFFASFVNKKFPKRLYILSSFVILCILQLIYAEYMFRGDIYADRAVVDIPQEYFKLQEYLEQNDSKGRIYYAPPSNNNYFREYEWGFWGSQFISYILPNPVMDMSLAVGSNSGENSLLEILNTVRSENKEEFLSLMQRYNVSYVLFDTSVKMEGYAFDLDEESVKSVFSDYKLLWSEGKLFLYEIPPLTEKVFTESLSEISSIDTFVKDISRFPTLSPLDMDLRNLRIEKNEILGEFEYRGYSTYMSSNLTKDIVKNLPTKAIYSNGTTTLYPSYPYVQGDNSVKPYRKFIGEYNYFVIGDSVISKAKLSEGITVQNTFSQNISAYGVSESDFRSINMIPLLVQTKGSDCSGDRVVESTFVTPQEIASGFSIEGTTESPCVYTGIPIDTSKSSILRVKLNWETERGNYPGYCIYSESKKTCLNKEKFLLTEDLFSSIDILLDTVVNEGERISLILYSTNIKKDTPSKVLFRSVEIGYAPLITALTVSLSSDEWESEDLFLDDGNTYIVHIPIVHGHSGYTYNGINSEYQAWQPNLLDSESKIYEVSVKDGLYQKVANDYTNQTANLLITNPNTKYFVYWKGENISNIPSSLCLIYDKEDKCWFQDMLRASGISSYLNVINGANESKLLNVIYGSSSYKLTTENVLKEFVFMEYPIFWRNLMYIQQKQEKYSEYEMSNVFKSSQSTYYKLTKEEIPTDIENILVSIPQAKSSGWVAVKRNGVLLNILEKDTRVSINGWKQGWDISNENFDVISVIYWPNLLSYFGYILILGIGTYLTIKFIQERKNGKK